MSEPIQITGPRTDRARIAPVPDWVHHEPFAAPADPEEVFISGGLCPLLDETQVNLLGESRAEHFRIAERVITNAGAERAAQFNVSFDPIYETLEVHFVRVIRGGQVIDHAAPEAFEVFRRERSLERHVYDGRLTVHLLIPDVRPGDIVESSWTVSGGNPILRGKHTVWILFEWSPPVLETRYRLLAPPERDVAFRAVNDAPAPEIRAYAGARDLRWRAVRRVPGELEELIPTWIIPRAAVQFSEFGSWREVADLFTPLYADAPLPQELEAAAADIRARCETQAEQAREVLLFVQRHVRYLALSLGEGGLQPRNLDAVWASRFGDCKDKARLFVALARRVGLTACPALVNTVHGEGLESWLPSAGAFDHAIVRVEVDGQPHWFDPTRRAQSGDFERLSRPFFGWALPLRAGQETLEHMGDLAPEPLVEVRELISFGPKVSDSAIYRWKTTYASWRADSLRDRLANEGAANLARGYLRQVQEQWPGAVAKEPMVVEDDHLANQLTISETYEIPSPWRLTKKNRVEFKTNDYFLGVDLPDLQPGARQWPIHLRRPRRALRTVEIELPMAWRDQDRSRAIRMDGLSFESKVERLGSRRVRLSQSLVVTKDALPADQADGYRGVVTEIKRLGEITIGLPAEGNSFGLRWLRWLGLAAAFGALAGAGLLAWLVYAGLFAAP